MHEANIGAAQRAVAVAKSNGCCVELQQLLILLCRLPYHTFTAAGVTASVQTNLVSVIDTRRSRIGELEQGRKLHCLCIVPAYGKQARRIMAIEQIECRLCNLLRIGGKLRADRISECLRIDFLIGEEIEHCIRERVIHNRIELVSLQPHHRVMPNLAQNISFRIDLLDGLPEFTPKLMIDLVGYVQSPPVNPDFFNPITRHLKQILLHFRVFRIQLWHQRLERERLVGWNTI
ncbi:hypothetical protein D3C78_1116550 [compost metagenome]